MVESDYYEVDRGLDPPASISDELRNELFGEDFTIKELDVNRFAEDRKRNFPFAFETHYRKFSSR